MSWKPLLLEMIPKEILKKVRRIQITTSRMVSCVFAGKYQSVFKGRGMEFYEVRQYLPGDEIRSIDWNVTARMGHPYVKKFIEERELAVMLLLDASMSCHFGSNTQLKNQLAAEICSVLSLSAIKNNDRVGLIIFTDKIEKFIPPRKGLRHVLRVIREALYYGADAVLLIARILSLQQLKDFIDLSQALGLKPLTEVHDRKDLDKAVECGAEIIGINNRDLDTFEVDINTTFELAPIVPEGCVLVSESGINNGEDIRALKGTGIHAILVGSALMNSHDLVNKTKEIVKAGLGL